MANSHISGFRWARSKHGHGEMPTIDLTVASAYGTALSVGQAVKLASDGTAQQAAAGDTIYGVIVGVVQYWDAAKSWIQVGATTLPASTTWGTNYQKRSVIKVVPVEGQYFRVDCDDAVTATTEAGYEAFINENCDHVISSTDFLLDISTHGTATAQWRIVDLINRRFTDFASTNVPLLVECNEAQVVPYSTGGVGVGT